MSCLEPPPTDLIGQPDCTLSAAVFQVYKDRVNPLTFSPSDILNSMLKDESTQKTSTTKGDKKPSDDTPEEDAFLAESGASHFSHQIVFPEDVPAIM